MLTVAALTAGRYDPPSRLRIRQHIPHLLTQDIVVSEYLRAVEKYSALPSKLVNAAPPRTHRTLQTMWETVVKPIAAIPATVGTHWHQITWLLAGILPGRSSLEPLLKRPLVLDIDDSIWLAKPHGVVATARNVQLAEIVVACNQYIADWLSQYTKRIVIIPTGVDTDRWVPASEQVRDKRGIFVVGWIGGSSDFRYFNEIEAPLATFLTAREAKLLVISNARPKFDLIPPSKVHFIEWSEENEVLGVQRMNVGIMPLPITEWTKGKCSFKMLEYMACGIPVVVSPIGSNKMILSLGEVGIAATTPGEWHEALVNLYDSQSRCLAYGLRGRAVAEEFFSRRLVTEKLAELFKSLA